MRKAAHSLIIPVAISLLAASQAHAEIAWQTNLRAAHAQAQQEGKLLLLHFYSDHCSWCEKLEKGAFQEPHVGQAISQRFVPVKVHANTNPKLAEMFKVNKFPTDVIVTTEGKTLSHAVSPQDPDRYVAMLETSTQTVSAGSQPAPQESIAAVPAAPTTQPSGSYPVPGYATADAPKPATASPNAETPAVDSVAMEPAATSSIGVPQADAVASAPAENAENQFALPQNLLDGGTQAQLTGIRENTFAMPGAASQPEPSEAVVAEVTEEQSISASIGDLAATETPAASPDEGYQLAPKQPELAMQGFCPVTVIQEDKWVEGRPEFGVIHLGKLYLFASEDKMQSFLSDPVPFTPVLNEIDAVVFFEERRIVPGKREWGLKDPIYNRMFFFADEASMNHFYNQYERYTKAAIEVMDRAVKDANPES